MHARVVKLSGVAALSSTARHAYRGGSWLAPGQPLAQPTQRRVHVSAVSDTTGVAPRTYTNYSIYKGKAALQVNYVPATFEPYQETSQASSRDGCLMLTFAASVGQRSYDWTKARSAGLVGEA